MLTSTGSWGSGAYIYDSVGNIRQRQEGSRVVQMQYDASDRLSQMRDTATGNVWHSYGYDSRGSVTFDANSLQTLAYDYADQPISMTGPNGGTYVYDGNYKRVKQITGGQTTYTIYGLSGSLLQRDNVTTGARNNFLSMDGKVVAEVGVSGAVVKYLHDDQIGSPATATSAAGVVLWRERYTPFGESLINDAAHADNVGFTGHIEDGTGLTYMQARYYDPVIGRFLAVDPVEFSTDQPVMFNRYSYVGNDPANRVDPTGKQIVIIVPGPKPTAPPIGITPSDPAQKLGREVEDGLREGLRKAEGYIISEALKQVLPWLGPFLSDAGRPADGTGLLDGATPDRVGDKRSDDIYTKPGGVDAANGDFDKIAVPESVKDIPGGGRTGKTPGGDNITVRPSSGKTGDGPATVEVTRGNGKERATDKVRYPEKK